MQSIALFLAEIKCTDYKLKTSQFADSDKRFLVFFNLIISFSVDFKIDRANQRPGDF